MTQLHTQPTTTTPRGAKGRPEEDEVVAALAGLGSALDDTPPLPRAVVLPLLATATVVDVTEHLVSSSLSLSRDLVAKGLDSVGWG